MYAYAYAWQLAGRGMIMAAARAVMGEQLESIKKNENHKKFAVQIFIICCRYIPMLNSQSWLIVPILIHTLISIMCRTLNSQSQGNGLFDTSEQWMDEKKNLWRPGRNVKLMIFGSGKSVLINGNVR